ncbi:MAG: bifunctional phosphoglucose/phosphomannose isomerase [Candidatus Omnitrophota bacterium]
MLDKSNMLGMLKNFPNQLKDAARRGEAIKLKRLKGIDKIVFSGLGGSAIGADLLRSYVADEIKLPIFINRNYNIPNFVDKKTLFITSSYSGNTEETLESYRRAKQKGAKIIAISSDGKLKQIAKRDGMPFIEMPGGYPPRCALGYSFILPLAVLVKLGLISNKDAEIKEAAALLESIKNKTRSLAKILARKIYNKFCVIYAGCDHIDSVATRWRGQIAENSKALASSHLFPEMNHNEIVGWRYPKKILKHFAVLYLRDKGDHPRVTLRMNISRPIIEKTGVKVIEIRSKGRGLLARILSLIYVGDFMSVYLAGLNKIDPAPVDAVTYLKNMLAKK